jgi:hypothetical protein
MKTNSEFKQKGKRIGSAGGFFNQLMSHNSSVPVVGEGATMLYHSDRHAYEVLEVNEKEKSCVIQRYEPQRTDKLGMSDSQSYKYEKLVGSPETLYWKYGAWRMKSQSIVFTDEAHEKFGNGPKSYGPGPKLQEAYKAAGGTYDGVFAYDEIEGLTKKKISWNKVNIIFGTKQEYYDYSF